MEKYSFANYKNNLSLVLCLIFILQFPSFGVAHYFLDSTFENEWAFSIAFWGINILLIFLIDFFHFGIPKSPLSFCSILIPFAMSICYFYTLRYRIYWLTVAFTVFVTIMTFSLRYIWAYKSIQQPKENTQSLKEESIIRLSLYILPPIFSSVICNHIKNAIPDSFFSFFVRFIYFIIAFSIVVITYIMWYKNTEKALSRNVLILEAIWLLICFSMSAIAIEYLENSLLTFFLPFLGIVPILMRHKETK